MSSTKSKGASDATTTIEHNIENTTAETVKGFDKSLQAVREGIEKYFIGAPASVLAAPRLTAVYVLGEARPPEPEAILPLNLPDAMRALDLQAYRPAIRARIGSKPHNLAQSAAVLSHAPAFRFVRPRGFEHMDRLVATLAAHWEALRR